jgi:hypothetical protein
MHQDRVARLRHGKGSPGGEVSAAEKGNALSSLPLKRALVEVDKEEGTQNQSTRKEGTIVIFFVLYHYRRRLWNNPTNRHELPKLKLPRA